MPDVSPRSIRAYPMGASGAISAFSSTYPFTWASGDYIRITGTYEIA